MSVLRLADSEAVIYYEYPAIEPNPMFAIGYCSSCGGEILNGSWNYCPHCGANLVETVIADCDNCKYFGGCCCNHLDADGDCMGYEPYVKIPNCENLFNELMERITQDDEIR